jgi:hypothetical protein
MNRWNSILRVFTAEYLGLTPAASLSSKRDPDEADVGGLEEVVANGHAADDLVSLSDISFVVFDHGASRG